MTSSHTAMNQQSLYMSSLCHHVVCLGHTVPMANCAAVQPSLSASRWSSLIFASCLRPSSLFTRSFSHWYPFTRSKMEKSVGTVLSSHCYAPLIRERITLRQIFSKRMPRGRLAKSHWPSLQLWSTLVHHHCTSLWLIHRQVETRSLLRHLREWNEDRRWTEQKFKLN